MDDGKSTLIGRLLHDSQTLYEDQLRAAKRDSVKHGTADGELDFALLVDGLQAEREQGITIDVAYRYFATSRRKFIIADTPGHEQYTRNMATGASNCDLAVILVDATRGLLDQTRRHAFIAALLGIKHLVVAVNKMDLAGFAEERFQRIREAFTTFAAKLQVSDVHFIPLSALRGDNVVLGSERMPWYRGSPLLDYLENVHIASDRNLIDLRLPVQIVLRPSAEFRGFAGTLASGILRAGDDVMVLPSGKRSHVRAILSPDGQCDQAFSPMPVTVRLDDEIDVSRGDMLVHPNNVPRVEREFEAMLVWMSEDPLSSGREYLLKQTTALTAAVVSAVRYRMNVNTLHREPCDDLRLNEIGRVRIETPRMLAVDAYIRNRQTGALILIDRISNATVAAGMILDRDPADVAFARAGFPQPRTPGEGPGVDDWERRHGQKPLTIRISGSAAPSIASALRTLLFGQGFYAEILDVDRPEVLEHLRAMLERLAIIAIVVEHVQDKSDVDVRVIPVAEKETENFDFAAGDGDVIAARILNVLRSRGFLQSVP